MRMCRSWRLGRARERGAKEADHEPVMMSTSTLQLDVAVRPFVMGASNYTSLCVSVASCKNPCVAQKASRIREGAAIFGMHDTYS